MTTAPVIEILDRSSGLRIRITAAPTNPEWFARPGHKPWCEIVLRENRVCAYGGELWPAAWPEWFCVGPRTIYGQETVATEAFLSLVESRIQAVSQ